MSAQKISTDSDLEAVLKVFDKTPKDLSENVEIIKKWLEFQPHLPVLDDRRIENLLIACKFSLEKTKQTIDSYLTVRVYAPEFFHRDTINDEELILAYDAQILAIMKGYTESYQRVIYFRWNRPEITPMSLPAVIKLLTCTMDLMLIEDRNTGFIVVVDEGKFKTPPLPNPVLLKKAIDSLMSGYRLRLAGMHYINSKPAFHAVMALMKAVMNAKLFQRLHVHHSLESLYKFVPKSMLPSDVGGEQGVAKDISDKLQQSIRDHREFFLKEQNVKSNEKLRPKDCVNKDLESLHGLDGSFRKLEID